MWYIQILYTMANLGDEILAIMHHDQSGGGTSWSTLTTLISGTIYKTVREISVKENVDFAAES